MEGKYSNPIIKEIHGHVVALKFVNHGLLQRNDRKMTMKWSFSYHSFVKLKLLLYNNTIPLDCTMLIVFYLI